MRRGSVYSYKEKSKMKAAGRFKALSTLLQRMNRLIGQVKFMLLVSVCSLDENLDIRGSIQRF